MHITFILPDVAIRRRQRHLSRSIAGWSTRNWRTGGGEKRQLGESLNLEQLTGLCANLAQLIAVRRNLPGGMPQQVARNWLRRASSS